VRWRHGSWVAAAALALVQPALAAPPDAADPLFEDRFASFQAGGYDALTVPVDWFQPVDRVAGTDHVAPRQVVADPSIDPRALDAAAQWAAAQNSTALLVQHNGQLVFERYWQSSGRDTRFNSQSMAKTVLALLVGQAIASGAIGSVDDPVGRYIGEWRDDPRGAITIADLLHMASGLEQLGAAYGYQVTRENPAARQHFGSDFIAPILTLTGADAPGKRFDYNNNSANLVGLVLERTTGKRYATLLSEGLWRPLGLADAGLYLDHPGGHPMYSCCIFSRPVDWLAIGQLILDRGRASAGQLVPAGWIDAMTSPSPAYHGYGYFTWIGDQTVGGAAPAHPGLIPWQSAPFAAPVVFLHGHGSQRVWIVPSHNLVIVRTGRDWPAAWDESMIPNFIIAGLKQAGSDDRASDDGNSIGG